MQDREGNLEELEDDKLYRLVADLYSGQMMGAVSEQSYGILSLVPKDAEGNEIPIENLEDHIIYVDGQELKAWACLAKYLDSFGEKGAELPEIPEYYSKSHGRKNIKEDGSLGAVMKNPNRIAVAIFSIGAGVLALLVLIIVLVVRFIRKRRRKNRDLYL